VQAQLDELLARSSGAERETSKRLAAALAEVQQLRGAAAEAQVEVERLRNIDAKHAAECKRLQLELQAAASAHAAAIMKARDQLRGTGDKDELASGKVMREPLPAAQSTFHMEQMQRLQDQLVAEAERSEAIERRLTELFSSQGQPEELSTRSFGSERETSNRLAAALAEVQQLRGAAAEAQVELERVQLDSARIQNEYSELADAVCKSEQESSLMREELEDLRRANTEFTDQLSLAREEIQRESLRAATLEDSGIEVKRLGQLLMDAEGNHAAEVERLQLEMGNLRRKHEEAARDVGWELESCQSELRKTRAQLDDLLARSSDTEREASERLKQTLAEDEQFRIELKQELQRVKELLRSADGEETAVTRLLQELDDSQTKHRQELEDLRIKHKEVRLDLEFQLASSKAELARLSYRAKEGRSQTSDDPMRQIESELEELQIEFCDAQQSFSDEKEALEVTLRAKDATIKARDEQLAECRRQNVCKNAVCCRIILLKCGKVRFGCVQEELHAEFEAAEAMVSNAETRAINLEAHIRILTNELATLRKEKARAEKKLMAKRFEVSVACTSWELALSVGYALCACSLYSLTWYLLRNCAGHKHSIDFS
jgi:hypothetical protein